MCHCKLRVDECMYIKCGTYVHYDLIKFYILANINTNLSELIGLFI